MESFYGGRQGASFVIKKSFKYVNTEDNAYKTATASVPDSEVMEACLSNPNYTDVWYNEYCIIDTVNKNNPNNGRIFRRRLPNETVDGKPYEDIGQIVGPSSGAAMLSLVSGLEANQNALGNFKNNWDALGLQVGNTLKYAETVADKNAIGSLKENVANLTNHGLVKGVEFDDNGNVIKQHKEIKYNWFNVRKNTEDNNGVVECWCHIGFEIPCTVVTAQAATTGPLNPVSVEEASRSKDNPFWYDLSFKIPRGLHGVSVKEIFIAENHSARTFGQLTYSTETGKYSVSSGTIAYNYKAWFCKLYIEELNATYDFYIGKVVEIKNVTFDQNTGVLTVSYHNQNNTTINMVYPKTVTWNKDTGAVSCSYYNSTSTTKMGDIISVEDLIVDSTHQLLVRYNNNSLLGSYNSQNKETVNGKEYINYGQMLGKLGVTSGPVPSTVSEKQTVDQIVAWYNNTHKNGVIQGTTEPSGQLHIVTTSATKPVSAIIMWNPETKVWEKVSDIAGGAVSVPAQIGSSDSWTYSSSGNLSSGAIRFVLNAPSSGTVPTPPWK